MNKLFAQLLRQAANRVPVSPRDITQGISRGFGEFSKNIQSIPGRTSVKPLINTARGVFTNLQNIGPTALNPLNTRTPTTFLGKTGQFFNPFNPANIIEGVNPAPGMTMGARLAAGMGLTGLGGSAVTIGGGLASIGAVDLLFPQSTADGTLDAVKKRNQIKDEGGRIGQTNEQGQYWAGRDYRYQSPASFNKLYGTRLQSGLIDRSGANPPGITPPSAPGGRQAGQMTPPDFSTGGMSNGAGVPAQRQDVQNRSLSQEVLNAAQQYSAPAGIPLSSFYEGQQQLGRSMMQKGTLVSELQSLGAGAGMPPENLQAWAKQNPDLAYRELLKLRGRQ